ncbi:MAG: hypothetical protein ACLSG5_02690 [Oscillospiraceae bacterium]
MPEQALHNTVGIAAVRYPGRRERLGEPSVSWDWSGKRGGTLAVSYRLSAIMTAAAWNPSAGEPVDAPAVRISLIPRGLDFAFLQG